MLVFIALDRADLPTWANGRPLSSRPGFAVTTAMVDAFGFDSPTEETAEYTALNICGLAGLLQGGSRLVAVADAEAEETNSEFGEVRVKAVGYSAVRSLFAPAASDPDLTGMTLAEAWDDAAVQEAIVDNPLLWYAPSEWNTLSPPA
jgi:hypothetical protein